MSSTFPLPLECLQLVIHHLHDKLAFKSLASLMCVNKYLCAATVPLLYQDPFSNMRPENNGFGKVYENSKTILGLKHLVRMLLCSLPPRIHNDQHQPLLLRQQDLVTELLSAAYFQGQEQDYDHDLIKTQSNSTETTRRDEGAPRPLLPSTVLPYYSFMTAVDFENPGHMIGCLQHNDLFLKQPAILDYLKRFGLRKRYLAENPFRHHTWANSEAHNETIIFQASERQLRRDLTWAMCYSNAEHVKTLHIALSDCNRFLALVPRLKVLTKVDFQLDESLLQSLQRDRKISLEVKAHLEEMISFVQEHQRHHPKVIRTTSCSDGHRYDNSCLDEYQFRLLQSLPPLHRPQSLGPYNWAQFAANIADTDLSRVKELYSVNVYGGANSNREVKYLGRILDQSPFLHRCRSLEKINIISFGEDMFKWAVQERKEFGAYSVGTASSSQLFPLREYHVEYNVPAYGSQINDVAYTFSNTLEALFISGYCPDNFNVQQDLPDFLLGYSDDDYDNSSYVPSWPELPRLSSLRADTNWIFLRVYHRLLSQLPSLVYLILEDKRRRYTLADVVHWEPAELPKLNYLTLAGTPAICFHPGTLKSTKNLTKFTLRMDYSDAYSYIPDPEEFGEVDQGQETHDSDSEGDSDGNTLSTPPLLRRQPVWTWDWDLPKLTQLHLTSEFAYRFQFRMLAGTPNLSYFSVDINSFSRKHRRTVGLADLVKPGFKHPALTRVLDREREQQEERKRIPYRSPDAYRSSWDHQEEEDDEGQTNNDDEDEVWQEFEFLHVPALKDFSLTGPWMFDYRAMKAFFGKVAPHIETLRLPYCYGFTTSEWVQSTAAHLHSLQMGFTSIQFLPRLVAEAGLVEHKLDGRYGKLYRLAEPPAGRVVDTPATYEFA